MSRQKCLNTFHSKLSLNNCRSGKNLRMKSTLCLYLSEENINWNRWVLSLCILTTIFHYVYFSCICRSYLYLNLYLCRSYLCLLERFIPSRFPSSSHLLRIHVVEGNNISTDVVSKWILIVGLLLKWNRAIYATVSHDVDVTMDKF